VAELIVVQLAQWIYSRTREFEADAYGLELCRRAGYDMKQCLEAFDILRSYSLDHHDIDGVYGPVEEYELDPRRAANHFDWLFIESRLWVVRHRRSHPAIVERLEMLRAQMESTLARAASANPLNADNRGPTPA
jgi:Zn-dependent protease with chaperone function